MSTAETLVESASSTKTLPLWRQLVGRIDEIEQAKKNGKTYSEFAGEFGVSAGAFSDALKRAKQEREKQKIEPDNISGFMPNFQIKKSKKSDEIETENDDNAHSYPELNEAISSLKSITKNLQKLTVKKTENISISERQIAQANKQISDFASDAADNVVEALNDAAAIVQKQLAPSRKQSPHKIILASAAVLILGLVIGFGLGSKSIYLSQNERAQVDAAKWSEFVRAYQNATGPEKTAVTDILKRYRAQQGSQ